MRKYWLLMMLLLVPVFVQGQFSALSGINYTDIYDFNFPQITHQQYIDNDRIMSLRYGVVTICEALPAWRNYTAKNNDILENYYLNITNCSSGIVDNGANANFNDLSFNDDGYVAGSYTSGGSTTDYVVGFVCNYDFTDCKIKNPLRPTRARSRASVDSIINDNYAFFAVNIENSGLGPYGFWVYMCDFSTNPMNCNQILTEVYAISITKTPNGNIETLSGNNLRIFDENGISTHNVTLDADYFAGNIFGNQKITGLTNNSIALVDIRGGNVLGAVCGENGGSCNYSVIDGTNCAVTGGCSRLNLYERYNGTIVFQYTHATEVCYYERMRQCNIVGNVDGAFDCADFSYINDTQPLIPGVPGLGFDYYGLSYYMNRTFKFMFSSFYVNSTNVTENVSLNGTCFDNILNQNETYTDYGGVCGSCLNNSNPILDEQWQYMRLIYPGEPFDVTRCDDSTETLGFMWLILLLLLLLLVFFLFLLLLLFLLLFLSPLLLLKRRKKGDGDDKTKIKEIIKQARGGLIGKAKAMKMIYDLRQKRKSYK
jgi:hypothetical protein